MSFESSLVAISVRLERGTISELERLASERGMQLRELIRVVLCEYLGERQQPGKSNPEMDEISRKISIVGNDLATATAAMLIATKAFGQEEVEAWVAQNLKGGSI